MAEKSRMRIGDLERESSVPRSTIHHYLHEGLLHPPYKTGRTMAYYDESHLKRLDAIREIKIDYLKTGRSSRVPLDLIKHRIQEGYTLSKTKGSKSQKPGKMDNEQRSRRKEEII